MTEEEVRKALSEIGLRMPAYWKPEHLKNIGQLSRPQYRMVEEKSVWVTMRDGVKLCVDIYRPDAPQKFPALLGMSAYGKACQGAKIPDQPLKESWVFDHNAEVGDINFYVSRGYAVIIPDERGLGQSEGKWHGYFNTREQEDAYDLIEWIAKQAWCNSRVGMTGISWFGMIQRLAAAQQPPSLKAIMPLEAANDLYASAYEGGILQTFWWDLEGEIPANDIEPESMLLYSKEEMREKARAIAETPDIKYNTNMIRILERYRSAYFDFMIHPINGPFWERRSGYTKYAKIKVPVYSGGAWMPGGFRGFSQSAFDDYNSPELAVPKKVSIFGHHDDTVLPGLPDYREEILRWWDHWLKDVDTGIMDEPAVHYWVMGANEWRSGSDWPLPETQWTKFYLNSWERLQTAPFTPSSAEDELPPDAFVQMPPTQTNAVARLRFMTDPLPRDVLIAGPAVLNLFAAIDQDDTNWFVTLKDIGPDVSVRSVREGERDLPDDLHERELTRGWLKASHRALDPKRSKPWRPWHPLR
jgi:putative CocE/NonD family hydrolase